MADGITRIAVEGFKSIANRREIEIAPLTILAGANSSGKSSIMQPLLMLKQTLEQTTDPGPLWIGGHNVKFTSTDQFLSRTASSKGLLTVELSTEKSSFAVSFTKSVDRGVEIVEERGIVNGVPRTLTPTMTPAAIQNLSGMFFKGRHFDHGVFAIGRSFFFLRVLAGGIPEIPVMEWIAPYILDVIHVPGLRGNPERSYPVRAVGPTFPGTFEDYSASIIDAWQTESNVKRSNLDRDLQHLGLVDRVLARRLNDVQIELQVNRLRNGNSDDAVNIRDVGFGVSQILPVVVALQAAAEGQLLYLEEPEIHLHPRAQVKLADILADAAKRGVRVVAETHSTLLLTAIQTLVAKGELAPELVKLHWFQRDPKTGVTQVTAASLDENGAFGDWPEDFGDVILSAEGGYLDAVTERSAH
jgi:hypothetical protein